MITNKEILITGGTGSLGKAIIQELNSSIEPVYCPRGIRVYSRDELKQARMKTWIKENKIKLPIAFLIGDVRDRKRIEMASSGVDIIIHCAAMKRIEVANDDPLECVKTNIHGTENVIYAALQNAVRRVFFISTDKAVYPTTLYGATKKVAEDLIINANTYHSNMVRRPMFSCARYGNVFGSNGSVIQLFKEQAKTGKLTITDPKMTRFWITLPDVARFVIERVREMKGNEIFIPVMPSMSIMDIAKTMGPDCSIEYIGIRGQEKLHECLITGEESRYAIIRKGNDGLPYYEIDKRMIPRDDFFVYSSDNNEQMTRDRLRKMLETI